MAATKTPKPKPTKPEDPVVEPAPVENPASQQMAGDARKEIRDLLRQADDLDQLTTGTSLQQMRDGACADAYQAMFKQMAVGAAINGARHTQLLARMIERFDSLGVSNQFVLLRMLEDNLTTAARVALNSGQGAGGTPGVPSLFLPPAGAKEPAGPHFVNPDVLKQLHQIMGAVDIVFAKGTEFSENSVIETEALENDPAE